MAHGWAETVTIELRGVSNVYVRIRSTRDAAHYLLEHWTSAKTSTYRIAIQSCSKALQGELNDSEACLRIVSHGVV